jgi:hypothetical protein
MSVKVKEWLRLLGVGTTHEERLDIDREIEFVTGLPCDEGVSQLTEQQFLAIVDKAKRKRNNERSTILAKTLA